MWVWSVVASGGYPFDGFLWQLMVGGYEALWFFFFFFFLGL